MDRAVLVALASVAVALGLYLRLAVLDAGSLWLDELWTLDAASRSLKEMVGARLLTDQSPPLWTTLTWFWLHAAGTYDQSVMRLLPLTFGVIGIASPILGAWQMRGKTSTFLVMAAFMALSLTTIQFSAEMRAYSMMMGLGSAATVIWAGLLAKQLPRTWPWIFLFALAGALSGFGHYYGNVPYVAQAAVLAIVLLRENRRALAVLIGWGALSLIPVATWLWFVRDFLAGARAAAGDVAIDTVRSWIVGALSPASQLLGSGRPGYWSANTADGWELVILMVAVAIVLLRRDRLGLAAAIVVILSLATAWIASVVAQPSMNVRNLAALTPVLFLGLAAALTSFRRDWLPAIAVGLAILASLLFVAQHGTTAIAPPWQLQAGYRAAAQELIRLGSQPSPPTLIGLDTWWDWHGQWDAAIRAELGAPPADANGPSPLPIIWTAGQPPPVDAGAPLFVFADGFDERAAAIFAWADETSGPCERETFGGPGFGLVDALRCPGDR